MQYVLDHWSDYRSWRVNVCGDSSDTVPDSDLSGNQYSLQRLQVEVDQFFLRAAQQIISAHRYVIAQHSDCHHQFLLSLWRMSPLILLHLSLFATSATLHIVIRNAPFAYLWFYTDHSWLSTSIYICPRL